MTRDRPYYLLNDQRYEITEFSIVAIKEKKCNYYWDHFASSQSKALHAVFKGLSGKLRVYQVLHFTKLERIVEETKLVRNYLKCSESKCFFKMT